MSSIRLDCSCGKQFTADVPTEDTGFAVVCPACGASLRIKPPWVSRDQFKKAVVPATVEWLADHMKKKGYYKMWASSVDGCSCSLCAKLEGTAVKCSEPFKIAGRSVMEPPLHDGCRCTLLWVKESNLEPRLVRTHNAFVSYSNAASRSLDFQSFANSFFASLYFLEQLASASRDDLAAAGMPQSELSNFAAQFRALQSRRDDIFNVAIQRAYDHEWKDSQSLKTELGRKNRMERLLQGIIASQALSPANYEYLKELLPNT